ncbi:hypothetical protein HispidOSU_009140, partial [Sigmodon hispidus]
ECPLPGATKLPSSTPPARKKLLVETENLISLRRQPQRKPKSIRSAQDFPQSALE